MKQLVIRQEDVYKVEDIEYFMFRCHQDYIIKDINTDISKNKKYILKRIAYNCELDCKKLNKKQLVDVIEKSGCLVLGN